MFTVLSDWNKFRQILNKIEKNTEKTRGFIFFEFYSIFFSIRHNLKEILDQNSV